MPTSPTGGEKNTSEDDGAYPPLRPGKLTEAWLSKTCFFSYYSEPPKDGTSSKSRGKRIANDDGPSSGRPSKRPHRPELVDQQNPGTMEVTANAQSREVCHCIPYSNQARVKAVQTMLRSRQRVPTYETPPADARDTAMERVILEDKWPATPPFSPLRKRYIPLSNPGE